MKFLGDSFTSICSLVSVIYSKVEGEVFFLRRPFELLFLFLLSVYFDIIESGCHEVDMVVAFGEIFMAMDWNRRSYCSSLPCPCKLCKVTCE